MTRTQQIVTLIEAAGPLSVATIRAAIGCNPYSLNSALRRLCEFEVLRRQNINGTRCFSMWQEPWTPEK